MAVATLLKSYFSFRRVRVALTVLAIALAVSLVVAVTSGYSSAEAAIQEFVHHYLGANNIDITPKGDVHQVVTEDLLERIEKDPDVRQAVGRLVTKMMLADKNGAVISGLPAVVMGVQIPKDAQVFAMKRHAGEWFSGDSGEVAVIDQVAAQKLQVEPGDSFELITAAGRLRVKVVGIVHKPAILAAQIQSVYLPLRTLQKAIDRDRKVSRILVDLKRSDTEDAFIARWTEPLRKMEPEMRLRRSGERRREMEQNLEGAQLLSYMGGTVAMLAATFIVFATLSMGVAERQRTLAMLRAVGAESRQIGSLVVYEGLLLAAAGILIGVPLGILWVHILAQFHKTIFAAGAVISIGGIVFSAVGMVIAAALASFLPAWSAMRLSPLDAMSPLGNQPSARTPWLSALIGVCLVAIDPILIFWPHVNHKILFWGHLIVGLPSLFLGFFLLAPAFVWSIERVFGRPIAFLLQLDWSLVRQQLSGSLWRAAGTAAALMVGLAILVVMQVQGMTMLSGWRLPDKFPDVFVMAPSGLAPEQTARLATFPGIRNGEVMPIALASPELGTSLFGIGMAFMPEATMFFGVDPDKAFDMMELDYRDGNAEDARRMLKQGRHVIVTDEFRQLKGTKVGDKIKLRTSMAGMVEYTVAAVVWSPGLDVMASAFDMGMQLDQRTAATVIGSFDDARRDFGIDRVYLFAANLEYGLERKDFQERLNTKLDPAQTQPARMGFGLNQVQSLLKQMGFVVGDVRHIKAEIQQQFHRVLTLLSSIALAAIAVASLGVTNTIMASIRSRQWQFGILRSIGLTRWQLLRMILAEAILLGLVGVALGLAAGFLMSADANRLTRVLIGYGPDLVVPWRVVAAGSALVLAVTFLASLWPALRAACQKPLELLQWGRAAA